VNAMRLAVRATSMVVEACKKVKKSRTLKNKPLG